MSLQTDSDLKVVLGVLVFLVGVMIVILFWHFIKLRVRRGRREGGLNASELDSLMKTNMLTKDEIARVRKSMAKQYLQEEKDREQASLGKGDDMKPLDALAWEARQAEISREKMPRNSEPPSELPARPALQNVDTLPASVPPEVLGAEEDPLPEHLQAMIDKPEQEIEDLFNAGFIGEEEYAMVMDHRRKGGCAECGDS